MVGATLEQDAQEDGLEYGLSGRSPWQWLQKELTHRAANPSNDWTAHDVRTRLELFGTCPDIVCRQIGRAHV